ncbi:MAG: MFS transporter [Actinomycetota bacterium]
MATHPNGAAPAKASKGSALTLVAMGISVLILANDFSALNVAIPEIEADLGASLDTTQWVINGYALVFAMAIVTGGRLADMFGRKRIYLIGAVLFGVLSLLGGLAPNIGLLIAARSAMGIGGALLWPATLGITYAALPKAKAGLAGALIIGAAGIGQGLGPILGGVLTELASWRWTLLINVPIVLVAIGATLATVHEPPGDRQRRHLDVRGIVTLSLALFTFLFSLDQSGDWGLTDPRIVGGFVLSVVLLVAFVRIERHQGDDALVPSDVMGNRSFRSACIAVALLAPVFFASLLYLPQFLQKVLDRSPIGAGVGIAADDDRVRRRLLRVGQALRPFRSAGHGDGGVRVLRPRAAPALVRRRDDDLRTAGARDGRDRAGTRTVLLRGHHLGGHLGRRRSREPGRWPRLHVPDRRRRDRPGPDHRPRPGGGLVNEPRRGDRQGVPPRGGDRADRLRRRIHEGRSGARPAAPPRVASAPPRLEGR